MYVPTDKLVFFSCILCAPGLSFAVASQAHLDRMIVRAKYSQSERRPGPKFRYRIETAASLLGVAPRSLRYGIHRGRIPVVRDGAGVFILADVLRAQLSADQVRRLEGRGETRAAGADLSGETSAVMCRTLTLMP